MRHLAYPRSWSGNGRLRTLVIQCSHNIYTLMFQRPVLTYRRSSLAAPRRDVAVAIDEPTTDDEAAN